MSLKLYWKRGDEEMSVLVDGNEVRRIRVTNKVRERSLQNPEDVVLSIPTKKPYMPVVFPAGRWKVISVTPKTSDYLAPYFILFDASVFVNVWELDEDLSYKSMTSVKVLDKGYGAHSSTSPTTLGCIKILFKHDTIWLAKTIMDYWKTSGMYTFDKEKGAMSWLKNDKEIGLITLEVVE